MAYWDLSDLQARISAEAVRQGYDDDNDGTPDAAAIARLQVDSDSFVDTYLRGIYDLDVLRGAVPPAVSRLSLDMAVIFARQRFPTWAQGGWKDLYDVTVKQLEDLHTQKTRLDVVGLPEPAAPLGGTSWAGGDDLTIENEPVFNGPPGTMGDW